MRKLDLNLWHTYLPQSFYVEGRVYDALQDRGKALESYGSLIELWKDADDDVPLLLDVKDRIQKLETSS